MAMRAAVAVAIIAMLAGCGERAAQSQAGAQSGAQAGAQVKTEAASEGEALPAVGSGPLLLSGQGIGWNNPQARVRLEFGEPREEIELALTDYFGAPPEKTSLSDCGAGAMAFSRYPAGLTLNFQDDALVGWLLDAPNGKVEVALGLAIGAPRSALVPREGFTRVDDSTLGEEYFNEAESLGGFIDDGKVAILHAGVNCFFR